MSDDPFYHSASRELQDRFDSRRIADRLVETRLRDTFDDAQRAIVESSPIFFLATADEQGRPDCSVKGGDPGFISVIEPNVLLFPEYDGNGMYRSLGNIMVNPNVGLLFIELSGERRKLRVNGTATLTDDPALLSTLPGARLAIRVVATEIFPNCPRYLPKMEIAERSVYNPRADYQPPEPFWKSKPDLRDFLPEKAPARGDS
jgi:predicted pyridoxine 5'-phosphate oxidase superfamily flavin-nucleotide-binding protein